MSPAQLAANRANAQKSTGPRTPEGKARSAQNARKHGFTATSFPVPRLEDLQEIARLRADLFALYQPRNSQEMFALERMALTQQAILRSYRLEAGILTRSLNEVIDRAEHLPLISDTLTADIDVTKAQNRNLMLAEGFIDAHRWHHNPWTTFLRYQSQAERLYRRALDEFNRARAEAPTLPEPLTEPLPDDQPAPDLYLRNEPNSDPNPLESQLLPDPETNPNPSQSPDSLTPDLRPLTPAERSDAPDAILISPCASLGRTQPDHLSS